ncbi:MAG: NlpC/P60 family protein [Bacilli bacterium]|nr:NlpC/P60 family protein [Bacilli bacterium]MDD4795163.1 NlpC/P60 family protein [Bacilli bacterium]
MDEELTNEELEAEKQEALDARSKQTNTKIAKTGAKAVANYFTAGQGGEVVELASKTRAGSAIIDAGGQALTAATKTMPMGDKVQKALNTADDAGAIDMVDKAMDGAAGTASSLADSNLDSGLSLPSDSPKDASPSLSPQALSGGLNVGSNPLNTFKIVGMIAVGLLLIIIIASNQNATLALTSKSGGASAVLESSNTFLTDQQIESKLIYIGDSQAIGMRDALNKSSITYIADVAKDYYWFEETALPELSAYISADTQKFVVIELGTNDLGNIDKYIDKYKLLKNNYQNVKFYFMEVGPVDEALALENGYIITNTQIDEFNLKLKNAFPEEYIDINSVIKDNFETSDGIHYLSSSLIKVHETVIKNIQAKNNFIFLKNYPIASESQILKGTSITNAISASGVNTLNNYINIQIEAGGKCTSAGVVGAAIGLIHGLHNEGYHLPYYYGGGHGTNNGVDLKWGTNIGPSTPTKNGNVYEYSGLDCSGFIAWAMNNAGVSGGGEASTYTSYGKEITFDALTPGDLLVSEEHVIMVIENKQTYLQCAEATTGGVQFTTRNKANLTNYKFIDMDNYYINNCMVG